MLCRCYGGMTGAVKRHCRVPSRTLISCRLRKSTDVRLYGLTPLPPPPSGRPADADLRIKLLQALVWPSPVSLACARRWERRRRRLPPMSV